MLRLLVNTVATYSELPTASLNEAKINEILSHLLSCTSDSLLSVLFAMVQQPPLGNGLILEASRSN
jgi:hypothetical protein